MNGTGDPILLQAVLRHVVQLLGVSGADLARRRGVDPSLVTRQLSGARDLTPPALESLVGQVGVPPALLERLVSVSAAVRDTALAPVPAAALTTIAEDLAAELGQRFSAIGVAIAHGILGELPPLTGGWARPIPAPCPADREVGEALFAALEGSPATGRLLVEATREYRHWVLCVRCCEESLRQVAVDPGLALEWASLARRVAELVPGELAWRSSLQGCAWAHVGNALRVQQDLPAADEAFTVARQLWMEGAPGRPDLLDEALLPGLEASLRRDQRRLPEALSLLGHALELMPTGVAAARHLVNKASVLRLQGRYEEALTPLHEALPLLLTLEEPDPRLLCTQRFGLVNNLAHLERHAEAEALLPDLRALTAQIGNDLDTWRLHWLEGRVAAGLERRAEAIETLARVRQEFERRQRPYDMALASLELATLYLEEGRTAEVKVLAAEMVPIFKAQGVHPEASAALALFVAAVEQERVTAAWAHRLVRYLYLADGDRTLRFEPPA